MIYEFAAKTEIENLSEIFFTGMKVRLRQKMILSSKKLVELEIICGSDRK